jgi:SAM-dependent methyltransferase
MTDDGHHYLIRGGIEGRERLRVLGRVMRPTTLPLLERAGVTAGMRCLDVGCGGGDVTFDLASLVGLTGLAVGVDVDATKIELARQDAEQVAVSNVEFRVGDIAGGLGAADDAEYDVVYARFLLTHLRDPVAAVAEMTRVLRPGGRLVVEDIDFGGSFCEPESAAFERYEEIYEESARRNGGDPRIALRLPAMLVAAGLARVQPHIVQHAGLEGESKVIPALTLENIRATALRHEVADDPEIDALVDELYRLARDPTTYVANPRMVQVIGEKPAS